MKPVIELVVMLENDVPLFVVTIIPSDVAK
jgi:hypothetical protein